MLADFAESVLHEAAAIFLAVVFIVMIMAVFSDFVFGMLGEIRRSWKQHMRD